jgi:membrane-bound serine protease (ClpP class)
MDLWLIVLLYVVGVGLVVLESMTPGIVIGLIGLAAMVVSTVFGFRVHPALGAAQILVALGIGPALFAAGLRRLSLRASLDRGSSYAREFNDLVGREGQTLTELHPSGIVVIDGSRFDVVTAGESVRRGERIRVMKVEGMRIVVKSIQEAA